MWLEASCEPPPRSGGFSYGCGVLKCKECGREYPLDARYVCERCFGPLEVAYDRASTTSRRCGAGSRPGRRTSGATRTSCRSRRRPARRAALFARRAARRLHAADARRPPGRAPRPGRGLGQERRRQPDALVQGPRRRGRRRAAPASWASTTLACASTGNLANAVAAHAAAAGLESYVFIPADLEEQKVLATGVYGTNLVAVRGNYDDVNRLCTELSGERDRWAFVNVNMRPYYAEGSKTLAYEIAEQLGWELPDRVVAPIASGSLFTKIAQGFEEWLELGLLDGEVPTMNGAQADGLLAGRRGVRGGPGRLPAGQARHDRQVAGHRQPGGRALRARARAHAPAARSTRSPTRRSARASACWPRPRASSPRPPAA